MTFLIGWSIFAVGILSASIPILIHLLHRQRTTPIAWGAMQFLLESPLQSKRRKKVEHWLLLALRVASLLLLAWLLARPISRSSANALLGRQPVDIAVVLDHSLSMGRRTGDHTVFDEARGVVEQVASTMKPGDTLSVVLAEHRPRTLNAVPMPARQTASLLQSVHQLAPGMTDCSIPEAVGFARELVERGRNVGKLLLIASDQQKSNWQIGDAAAWNPAASSTSTRAQTDQCWLLPLGGDASASNISIGDIAVEPALVGVNRPAQITVSVTNQGSKDAGNLNLHLSIDGKDVGVPTHIQTIGVGQSNTVHFDHTFNTGGSHWIRVWTDLVDALPADNSRVAGVEVWQKLPVLIIDGQITRAGTFAATRFLQAAMQPVDPASASAPALIAPTVVSVAESSSVKLEDYNVVLLNDVAQLPPAIESKLIDYVESGHGVWVLLGARTSPAFITDTLGPQHSQLARLALKQPSPITSAKPPAIQINAITNPMVAMIAASDRNALAGAVVKQWWSIAPQDGDAQVVISTAAGDPLVLERPVGSNGGRVVVWTTSADSEWNNWPAMPNFVPLINETLYYLSAPQTQSARQRNVPAGSAITWSGQAEPAVLSVDVTLPDGSIERGRAPLFRNGHWEFQYPNTFLPGLYQLRFAPTGIPQPVFYGVGINRRELEISTLTEQDRRWLSDHHLVQTTALDRLPALVSGDVRGVEIWKWLAIFVVASLLLETAMTYRMIGLQQKSSTPVVAWAARP